MTLELPKRIFRLGNEPEVEKINNRCCTSLLATLESAIPSEYAEVKKDKVFADIMAIHKNGLGFSGRLVHRFMCNQLSTSRRHEHWFTFASKPLRFSLQEFHAITGLKCKYDEDDDCNYDDWRDDGGYWSKLLKRRGKINIHLLKEELKNGEVNGWLPIDRIRLVYLAVIASVVMAGSETKYFSHTHIKLAMNLDKLRKYPWGLHSYDLLVESITKSRVKLNNKISYTLDGFFYALQIWIMEAIPDIGTMLGRKLNEDLEGGVRCSNWIGAARVSYDQITQLESAFDSEAVVYPYISKDGNNTVVDSIEFFRADEMRDVGVEAIKDLIRRGHDWTAHTWEVDETWNESNPHQEDESGVQEAVDNEDVDIAGTLNGTESSASGLRKSRRTNTNRDAEAQQQPVPVDNEDIDCNGTQNAPAASVSGLRRSGKRIPDHGAESRKRKLLCQRSAIKSGRLDESTKSFIQGLITASFSSLEESMDKKYRERFEKLEGQFTGMQEAIDQLSSQYHGAPMDSTRATTSATVKGTRSPAQAKVEKTKGEKLFSYDNLFEVNLTQSSDILADLDTQEFLQKTVGRLSQDSVVDGFDSSQHSQARDRTEWLTPKTSFKEHISEIKEPSSIPVLSEVPRTGQRKSLPDDPLIYVSEEQFDQLFKWRNSSMILKIGPSVLDIETADRIIGFTNWLATQDMDAVMYLFQEKTSLGRWKSGPAAFMTCLFSNTINAEYTNYKRNKKKFKLSETLLDYGKGVLPSHGRTDKMWGMDVDRIYVPVFVNGNHWISLCISFVDRRIEVFDCSGKKNCKEVEAFAFLIPRIVKQVQPPKTHVHLKDNQYSVFYVPMQRRINSRCCNCGVYALKFIECHVLGMDFALLDDENIKFARQKIVFDLFQAALDPVLVERMSAYKPPVPRRSDVVTLID